MQNSIGLKKIGQLPGQMHIAQLHYHLAQAGVRVVIENTIDAIMQYFKKQKLNIFVMADAWAAPKPKDLSIDRNFEKMRNVRIKTVHMEELDYDLKQYKSKKQFLQKAEELKEKIIKKIPLRECSTRSPFILHCHGLPLGKNPKLSCAIKLLAEECEKLKSPIWILNQVHDFSENSRPEMLRNWQFCTGSRDVGFAASIAYPIAGNIFYATINSRDAENLIMAGIPKERIFFLPDSIDTDFFGAKAITTKKRFRKQLLSMLDKYSKDNKYFFDERKRILLSPLKAMRRKNNAESILFLSALNSLRNEYQLVITLEAHSGGDVAYENKIKRFVRKHGLPVVIGPGMTVISDSEERERRRGKITKFSMVDLFAISKAVLTTSIIEGFGFAFHEGWLTGTPVIGRRLPYVCRDFEKNGLKLRHMYKKMWVAIDWLHNGEKRIIRLFEEDVNELRTKQGLPKLSKNGVEREVKKTKFFRIKKHKCIDFKELNIEMQLEIIKNLLKDEKQMRLLLCLNPVIRRTAKLIEKKPVRLISHNKGVVKQHYSLKAKARRLKKIYLYGNAKYLRKIKKRKIDNRKVIYKYIDLDYIHPLTVR